MKLSSNCLLAALSIGSTGAFVTPQASFRTNPNLAATLLENWEVTEDGCVVGQTRGHPEMNDGDIISTSPLANPAAATAASFVSTMSGSEYLLGTPKAPTMPPQTPVAVETSSEEGGLTRNQFLAGGGLAAVLVGMVGVTNFLGDSSDFVPAATTAAPSAPAVAQAPAAMAQGQEWVRYSPGPVEPKSEIISPREVSDLFELWNRALQTGNPDTVATRYADGAVLLPTKSDIPRTDYAGIRDYFVHFLEKKPTGRILESYISTQPGSAMDVGIYEFAFANGAKIRARYSFIYKYIDGQWKIKHHHSSGMPEAKGQVISEAEVRGLFNLWNNALLTGDSDAVTKRYAKGAVLLPTVSDIPRTTYEGIKDYFDHFLELKPDGKIIESYVSIGENWCKDVGIYEFVKGTDGTSVRARYSFVYVFEDGEWKISHHHSSLMPEPLLAKAAKA